VRVTVEFFGPAREAAGVARQAVECETSATSHDVVTRLARHHGGRLARLLLDGDQVASSVLLAVNDVQAARPVSLKEGDEITVVPPVSGGCAQP
jgi:molybdopterin converting factor small subunit